MRQSTSVTDRQTDTDIVALKMEVVYVLRKQAAMQRL